MNIHESFRRGAETLAEGHCKYTELHKGHGIDPFHWKTLTQTEYWTPDQARGMRTVIANVMEVSMTIAGMPPVPLPGQFAAALIAIVIAPANRLIACHKCPETFDAMAASGLMETFEVKPMKVEQLMALVVAYSGNYPYEPQNERLPREVQAEMKRQSKK